MLHELKALDYELCDLLLDFIDTAETTIDCHCAKLKLKKCLLHRGPIVAHG